MASSLRCFIFLRYVVTTLPWVFFLYMNILRRLAKKFSSSDIVLRFPCKGANFFLCAMRCFVVFHCPHYYISRPVSNFTCKIPFLVLCLRHISSSFAKVSLRGSSFSVICAFQRVSVDVLSTSVCQFCMHQWSASVFRPCTRDTLGRVHT